MKLHFPLAITLLSLCGYIISCSNTQKQEALSHAESLIETHPDSALTILSDIDKKTLAGREQQARYALLMSMALDKNYIDTTTFDVLQPAIDYYLKKGTSDEKLKTYYYQGRIFQNKGDRDSAFSSFIKGIDNAPNCTDSTSIIRTHVALAYLYYEFYDFNNYTHHNLAAADICRKISHKNYEFECLLNALNGSLIIEDKHLADSIINLCNSFESTDKRQNQLLSRYKLTYASKYASNQEIKDAIDKQEINLESDISGKLNLALAYNKLGDNDKAKALLDYINNSGLKYDTLKYQAISVSVLKDIGNYEKALSAYYDFNRRVDSINHLKLRQKIHSLEEKHRIELKAQKDARQKSNIIWGCIGGIVLLAIALLLLFLFAHSNKIKKELALEKVKTKESENAKLKSEKEKLALENNNLQLERDNKALEAENLAYRVEMLKNESDNLKSIIKTQEELPHEVQNAIKVRIEMLNSLLASHITNNDQYEKPYDIWIKELTENTEEFMNSNRLAFQASHPQFIRYFEEHGLSVKEINYVCLYAIGLRGKEVGNYIKKRSHVNTSSAIRKKLGIDKHETNLGIYVRKLLKQLS